MKEAISKCLCLLYTWWFYYLLQGCADYLNLVRSYQLSAYGSGYAVLIFKKKKKPPEKLSLRSFYKHDIAALIKIAIPFQKLTCALCW